jgi:leucyl aminopeptidase
VRAGRPTTGRSSFSRLDSIAAAMEIDVAQRPPEGATLIVPLPDPPGALPEGAEGIAELLSAHEASAERGSARLVHVGDRRLVAVGLGARDEVEPDALRDAAAAAVRELAASVGGDAAWLLDESLPLSPAEQIRAAVEGAVLGCYDPGAWKTAGKNGQPVERLTMVGGSATEAAAGRAAAVAAWTNYARDLANAPANELTPAAFADRAAELSDRFDTVVVEALEPDEMRERGMGALLGVGMGSHNPPRLIVLRYEPAGAADGALVLGLVGKGITFDSGGIALKPPLYMEEMRGDMSGAAAVVAATGAIAELGLPVRVLTVVAAAENVMGGGSFRPGDVLTASNGKTIEITNTDAEGRLVLADALVYARGQGATHVVDLATLTGAMSRALGDLYAGVFANDDAWRAEIVEAGEASGDHVWPWPLHPRYRRFIQSDFADLKNHSVRGQGIPVYAAEFLREFAGEGPWAHLDIAGPAFLTWPRGDYLWQRGGTGYGVRLLAELASRLAAAR